MYRTTQGTLLHNYDDIRSTTFDQLRLPPAMTDKCRKPNFAALVLRMRDGTNAEGKYLTLFMLIKAYPF